MKPLYIATLFASAVAFQASAGRVLCLPMEVNGRESLPETVGGSALFLFSKTYPENINGAVGKALRFDGFSTYAQGAVRAGAKDAPAMTFSMWVAPETYPVVALDTPTDEKIRLAGTLDDSARAGWQFSLGYSGRYAFECYSGGWKVSVEASDLLPCYEWSRLVAVFDGAAKTVTLYRNGQKVGQSKCMNTLDNSASTLSVGRGVDASFSGPFMINTFNGLIDEVEAFDSALPLSDFASSRPQHDADLSIPASRFEAQSMRPRFHGMPAAAWTNECHGMTYSNGRFHLFFQKNANGPYMTRLHWGHISSPDLINWEEHPIAIAPGDAYDIKGCWSGAVFTDPVITANKPAALYTAVDYAKASIAMALPDDDNLLSWTKRGTNPIISGRPQGLSDDFRDPCFFRNGNDAYIIVGTSKDGRGAVTLHKYNAATGSFSNDGNLFFRAADAASQGSFWEMPNITPMPGGKWLFTVTPLGLSAGVRCLAWVGHIASDGTFVAESGPANIELNSKEGYGLLSPTIYSHDGKVIALGIVPDKLPGERNYELGWAHCYSLPREWSLAADGSLIQKPYSGLQAMRSNTSFSLADADIEGSRSLSPVSGRKVELLGSFTVGQSPFGFRFFGKDGRFATLSYQPASGQLVVDFSAISRWVNDAGVYDGVYRLTLPERPLAGSELKINLFIDGSILDIFVNDRWAQSIRVFPADDDASEIALFAEGKTHVRSLHAWKLSTGGAGVEDISGEESADNAEKIVNVYHISGALVKSGVEFQDALSGLERGIYIVDGRKVAVR